MFVLFHLHLNASALETTAEAMEELQREISTPYYSPTPPQTPMAAAPKPTRQEVCPGVFLSTARKDSPLRTTLIR